MGRNYADGYFDPAQQKEIFCAIIEELDDLLEFIDEWVDIEDIVEYLISRRDKLVQFSSEQHGDFNIGEE